jgi:hypothetical protein
VRALTAHRQRTAVSESTIAADIHQALDVHLDALSQIAFAFSPGISILFPALVVRFA